MKKLLGLLTVVLLLTFGCGVLWGSVYQGNKDIGLVQSTRSITEYKVQGGKFPTGYDVWNEANRYRLSQGEKELELWDYLCNNIAERAINYRNTNSHDGLDTFHERYMPKVQELSEILNYGTTAKEIVQGWASSPSHNLSLLKAKKGCAYSGDGYSVMLLSK